MRTTFSIGLVAMGVTAFAGVALAQEPGAGLSNYVGSVDFGARLSSVSGDEQRFQRYRDLRDGPTASNLTISRRTDAWTFDAAGQNIGYRDQRYVADYVRDGRAKAFFEWNSIPLNVSGDTLTAFTTSGRTLQIDDAIQRAVEGKTATLADVVARSNSFEVRNRRDIARLNFTVTPQRDVDLKFNLTSTGRSGTQVWGTSFGHSSSVEVPVPLDTRTTDTNASIEWANRRGTMRLAYDGSWFNNQNEPLVWDNPSVFTDSTAATSHGRSALWPSSTAHTVSGTGAINLPARSRATAVLSIGSWLQDGDLLPFTINSAITPIPLSRTSANAEARITSMAYGFSSRPTDRLWFNARYRLYDFDNRTPPFVVTNYVAYDTSVSTSVTGGSEPYGYKRHFFDADASYTPLPFAAFRVGYGRETDHRTHRSVETTTDQMFRASIDSTGSSWVSVRALYEHSKRVGTGLDEEVLDEIGEQTSLRQFDISDRNRDRVWLILQLTPKETFGVTASVGAGKDRRPDVEFGLVKNDHQVYSIGFDAVPSNRVNFGLTYGFEDYSTLQNSRQANPGPQFDDPTRNWSDDAADKVHTITASATLEKLFPKTDLHFSYDLSHATSQYTYLLPPDTTLVVGTQLSPLFHDIDRVSTDLQYFLQPQIVLGLEYLFERYRVDEFGLDQQAINRLDLGNALVLGFVDRPYTANVVSVRLSYRW
jgi:MtrB/PioB family decaheme-associated outer membrane protein